MTENPNLLLELPPGWRGIPLRALARRRDETGRPDLPLLSVYREFGIVEREGREDNFNKPGMDLAMYRVVYPGDLVMNKMKTWQGSLGVSRHHGIVSPAYFVCELNDRVDSRFLHYTLRSQPYIAEYAARSKGIRPGQWDLPWDEFKTIQVAVPGRDMQVRIANFLDRETARIHALVRRRRSLIETLSSRWAAEVYQAVTKGLDTTAPLAACRLEWVSTMPAHWTTPPVYANFDVQLGKMLNPERAAGPNLAPYLRNENVQWNRVSLDDLAKMSFDEADRLRYSLRPGDLLVCEGGEVGRAAVWRGEMKECYYQKALHRVRSRGDGSERFLMYCLWAAALVNVFNVEGNQATIVHLTAEKLRAHRFPMPPRQEQEAIVEHLDHRQELLATLKARIELQLTRLYEHREALTTAATTGQIEFMAQT